MATDLDIEDTREDEADGNGDRRANEGNDIVEVGQQHGYNDDECQDAGPAQRRNAQLHSCRIMLKALLQLLVHSL